MKIELSSAANAAGKPLDHFWSRCVGAGRANEGLRASFLEQLKLAHESCGFQYLRFHGLFHDDMFVYRVENGQPIYNFQYVDDLFDRLLDIGIRPFVEFGFCPGDLATQKETVFWWKAHGSPPNDYARWGELIERTVRHWLNRYGIDELRKWYFEVWNEANLHAFFEGTRSQYFELYKITVAAVKRVDARLRVGGPATSNYVPDDRFAGETEDISQHSKVLSSKNLDALQWRPVWLEEFLSYCHREKLPVDFVSFHPYPTDWALDAQGQTVKNTRGVDATRKDLAMTRRLIDASPFPKVEIHLTEWSSSPSAHDYTHDYLQAGTFVVKANLESIGLVNSLSYWIFTDILEENGGGETIFHGGFGMINFQGIVKPVFHAYRLLHMLGDELLIQVAGGVVTRSGQNGKLAALAYHYPPEEPLAAPASFFTRDVARKTLAKGTAGELGISLANLRPGAAIMVETLDKTHGNAMAAWEAMGSPETPTREQTAILREAARATRKEMFATDKSGKFELHRSIDPWSVVLIAEV